MLKEPRETISIVTRKTLSVKNELVAPTCSGYNSPLNFYDKTFSRFVFAVINENKVSTTGNIRADEIADIVERSKFIYHKDMELAMNPPATADSSLQNTPGCTVVLTTGNNGMKGKTPVQFLLENPQENQRYLTEQYQWLKNNLGRNPRFDNMNRKQMDAIMDASRLFKAGKLEGHSFNQPQKEFVIYDSGLKPLVRKKDRNGNAFVYTIRIVWTLGKNYPLAVEIANFYAPTVKTPKGLYNVQVAQKQNEIKNVMNLFAKDWNHVLYMIQMNMRMFEVCHAKQMYQIAEAAEQENRRAAGIPDR